MEQPLRKSQAVKEENFYEGVNLRRSMPQREWARQVVKWEGKRAVTKVGDYLLGHLEYTMRDFSKECNYF